MTGKFILIASEENCHCVFLSNIDVERALVYFELMHKTTKNNEGFNNEIQTLFFQHLLLLMAIYKYPKTRYKKYCLKQENVSIKRGNE